MDRISALPEGLVDYILSFLTDDFGVVVRTSVLSKRWRHCWRRVRKLCFDTEFIDKYVRTKELEVVVSFVDSILSRHDGPLDHFSLNVVDARGFEVEALDLCRWMDVLSEKGIRELSLLATPCYVGNHSRILCCPTLSHLSLHWCDFGPSSEFSGITRLVSLRLEGAVMTGRLLEAVIANSPLLRELDLTDMCMDDNYCVVIDAPGLEGLYLNTAGEFCLKEYPNLTSAYIGSKFEISGLVGRCKLDKFARIMPRVERLTFDTNGLKALAVGNIPVKLTSAFENLTLLDFDELDILALDQLPCFFSLIRSAPNLQSLEIYVTEPLGANHGGGVAAIECYEAEKKKGVLSQLSTLRVDNMLGHEWEVKFISTFINCCPMLETFLFSANEDIEKESEEWLFKELDKLEPPEAAVMEFESQQED